MNSEQHGVFNAGLLEGVAISSLTFLAAAIIPFAGSVVLIFTPLPILYYCCKLGRLQGLTAFCFALLLVAGILWILDSEAAFPSALCMQGFLGMILAELFRRKCTLNRTVLYSVSLLVACGIAIIGYESILSGKPPPQLIETYIGESLREGFHTYSLMGVPPEKVAVLRDNIGQMTSLLTGIYPALFVVMVLFAVWLNILLARWIFHKKGLPYPDFVDFALWKTPERLIWIFICAGGLLLLPLPWGKIFGLNLLIVCSFVYFLAGLAIIGFFFKTKNTPRFVRLPCYLLIFVQQYFAFPVIALGLFDLWVDFRKYIKPVKILPL